MEPDGVGWVGVTDKDSDRVQVKDADAVGPVVDSDNDAESDGLLVSGRDSEELAV